MRPTAILCLCALALAGAPRPASACENIVVREIDPVVKSIRRAEALLARGDLKAAAREVLATFPDALRTGPHERKQALLRRGQRIVALALVRSGGAVRLGHDLPGKTAEQRAAGLAWAAGLLRLHYARTGDVAVRAELAEALAAVPTERAEALAILRELGDGDLLPTARAWALLAALERDRGDATAAARADRRCREIDPAGDDCRAPTA